MTKEQNIALELACDLAAELLEEHTGEHCCCEDYGHLLSEVLRQRPKCALAILRQLRDGIEYARCGCCVRTCQMIRQQLMRYEYELSVSQIEAILGR